MIQAVDVRHAVVNVARSLLWVKEEGPNRGQAVEAILRRVGLPAGCPWCAAFVSYVGRATLNGDWPLPMVGGCATLGELAAARAMLSPEPTSGAIFLQWSEFANRYRHTGFVLAVIDGECATIEGNTSPDGSPEGTGVFSRRRTFGPNDRFIHWWR